MDRVDGGFEIELSTWQRVADAVSRAVGDGCVIRRLEPGGLDFAAVAVGHSDPRMRGVLAEILDDEPVRPPHGAWLRQVLASGKAMALADSGIDSPEAAGLPADRRIGDVALVPVMSADAVIVAVRGHASAPFGLSERRRLEEIAARAARQRGDLLRPRASEPLLDGIAAAIALTDRSGNMTYVNQACCELVGTSADRLVGAPLGDLIQLADDGYRAGFSGTEPGDHLLRRPDGSTGWASVSSRPLFDRAGDWHATLYTMVDVTARKEREIEMRTSLDCERMLAEFAELVLHGGEGTPVLPRAVDLLAEQFGAPLVVLASVARDHAEVRTLAASGALARSAPERWLGSHEVPRGSATLTALESGEAVTVSDFAEDGYTPGPIAREAAAASAACVPIRDDAACLAVVRREPGGVERQEVFALEGLAGVLSSRWPALAEA